MEFFGAAVTRDGTIAGNWCQISYRSPRHKPPIAQASRPACRTYDANKNYAKLCSDANARRALRTEQFAWGGNRWPFKLPRTP